MTEKTYKLTIYMMDGKTHEATFSIPLGGLGSQGPAGEPGPAGVDGKSMIYYNQETEIDEAIGAVVINYSTAHDWTVEFSAVPKVGDMVISANKQLFKVELITDRKMRMAYIMDLSGGEATPSDERQLTGWTITENGDTVTLDYTLEGNDAHKDVITFDAEGYPISINHDGFVANGTWSEASDE